MLPRTSFSKYLSFYFESTSLDNLFYRSASLITASEEFPTIPYDPVPTADLSLNLYLKLLAKHLLVDLNERALNTRELKEDLIVL